MCSKRQLRGTGNPHLCILFLRDAKSKKGRGEKNTPSLNIDVFNMHGCGKNVLKKGEIGKMCLRRRLDVCALSETKLKGKGEVMFGEVVGRVSDVEGGRGKGWPCFSVGGC